MKKLKSIFSPRKLVVILLILTLFFTVPELNKPSMSQTEAIVTMLSVDVIDGKTKITTTVLTPSQDKTSNYQVYTGSGETMGKAVESISHSIGKDMGFAQCEIMALGENVCKQGVMPVLDYFTRTKKVGRGAVLINFEGDVEEFAQAICDLSKEKALSLGTIIDFDKQYILSCDSNTESFYKGYYSKIKTGIMPLIKLEDQKKENSIEISGGGGGGASEGGNSGGNNPNSGEDNKKYLVNDGTMAVFKEGKKYLNVSPEHVKRINYFVNNSQKGEITVNNVVDYLYNDASVVVDIIDKKSKTKVSFDGDTPVFKSEVNLTVFVEQVIDEKPDKEMLRRNEDFLTDTLVEKIKEQVTSEMTELINYSKENKIDLIDVYKLFNSKQNKKFKEFLSRVGEDDYLSHVRFETEIKIANEY